MEITEIVSELIRALRLADKSLNTIRNAQGNTLNPHHISQEAYHAHESVRRAIRLYDAESK